MRKTMNLENTYNPNMLGRTTDPMMGLSTTYEDDAIKNFGAIPMWLNLMPRTSADMMWKKMTLITKTSTMT
jgi:hypothetical protein